MALQKPQPARTTWIKPEQSKISFLCKFGPKNRNCLFNMKMGVSTHLNMLTLQEIFICPAQIWTKKLRLLLFKLKLGA